MGDPVIHFEVIGTDGPTLGKFYGELFGWHIQSMPEMNYEIVDTHAGSGINGGVGGGDPSDPATFTTVYVEVADPQASLDKAVSLGATVAMPVMAIPGAVTLAQFFDPQGCRIGLVKSEPDQGAMGVSAGDNPAVGWFEILGSDALALHTFYSALFGWKFPQVHAEFGNYGEVDTDSAGRGIPGGVGTSQGEPTVTVYAAVDDLAKYLERATSLGGEAVLQPMPVGEGTTIAAFRDPQGNLFGLMNSTS